jgi:putative SOS response-associated peptidase YedK
MFRSALAKRRCLVPASAFCEWRASAGGKQPYAIAKEDSKPMAFAVLWEGRRSPEGRLA